MLFMLHVTQNLGLGNEYLVCTERCTSCTMQRCSCLSTKFCEQLNIRRGSEHSKSRCQSLVLRNDSSNVLCHCHCQFSDGHKYRWQQQNQNQTQQAAEHGSTCRHQAKLPAAAWRSRLAHPPSPCPTGSTRGPAAAAAEHLCGPPSQRAQRPPAAAPACPPCTPSVPQHPIALFEFHSCSVHKVHMLSHAYTRCCAILLYMCRCIGTLMLIVSYARVLTCYFSSCKQHIHHGCICDLMIVSPCARAIHATCHPSMAIIHQHMHAQKGTMSSGAWHRLWHAPGGLRGVHRKGNGLLPSMQANVEEAGMDHVQRDRHEWGGSARRGSMPCGRKRLMHQLIGRHQSHIDAAKPLLQRPHIVVMPVTCSVCAAG